MTKKKTSAKKKLLPAAGMLAISAAMLASSTYAWFTMNKEVTVTGMQLKTKVGSNLLVTGDNVEANYTNDLVQTRAALLEPVSTVSGVDGSFFYTVNAKANGDANADEYAAYNENTEISGFDAVGTDWTRSSTGAAKAKYDATFNGDGAYNISTKTTTPSAAYQNAYGYVDYTFYLKATSDAANQEIRLTECNLIYNNAAIADSATGTLLKTDNDLAWRVAIFAEPISQSSGTGDESANVTETTDSPLVILTRPNSENQTANYAVSKADGAPTALPLSYNTWRSINNAEAKYIDKIATSGTTAYYKVVARVWLEGEDKSCKSSTYALLTNEYELGLQFELVDSTDTDKVSVTNIGSATDNDTGKIMAPANNNNQQGGNGEGNGN